MGVAKDWQLGWHGQGRKKHDQESDSAYSRARIAAVTTVANSTTKCQRLKLYQDNGKEFKALREQAMQLGRDTRWSASEAAEHNQI